MSKYYPFEVVYVGLFLFAPCYNFVTHVIFEIFGANKTLVIFKNYIDVAANPWTGLSICPYRLCGPKSFNVL